MCMCVCVNGGRGVPVRAILALHCDGGQVHVLVCVRLFVCCMCLCMHACMCACMFACLYICMCVCNCFAMNTIHSVEILNSNCTKMHCEFQHSGTHTHMCAHATCTHIHTRVHIHMCTWVHVHTYTHVCTFVHVHTYIHACTCEMDTRYLDRQTHIHSCMHACTLTHTYMHAYVSQVRWGRGIPMQPHVVALEAGLDSRAFDEDLPIAPWL